MAIGITLNINTRSTSPSITLGGTCTKLVVSFVDVNNNTGIAITYNGISLTQGVVRTVSGMIDAIWYLDNPPTGAAYTLSITGSGAIFWSAGIYEITGAAVGIGATQTAEGTGTSTSLSITTTANNSLILNQLGVQVANASSPSNGETQIYTDVDVGGNYRISGSYLFKAVAGAQTTGYTHGSGGSTLLTALEILEAIPFNPIKRTLTNIAPTRASRY
jgi:hypothetical protein